MTTNQEIREVHSPFGFFSLGYCSAKLFSWRFWKCRWTSQIEHIWSLVTDFSHDTPQIWSCPTMHPDCSRFLLTFWQGWSIANPHTSSAKSDSIQFDADENRYFPSTAESIPLRLVPFVAPTIPSQKQHISIEIVEISEEKKHNNEMITLLLACQPEPAEIQNPFSSAGTASRKRQFVTHRRTNEFWGGTTAVLRGCKNYWRGFDS